MKLYTLTSDLHLEIAENASSEPFVKDIESALGEEFTYCDSDFSTYGSADDIIYVRTGGTEGIFKKVFCQSGSPLIPGGHPVRLLAGSQSNSLAAAMEILSFLNNYHIEGQILHGSSKEIASQLRGGSSTAESMDLTLPVGTTAKPLAGKRYGVIGKPSDWLISSDVDYAAAKDILGAELIDIDINEFVEFYNIGGYRMPGVMPPYDKPKFGKMISGEEFRKATYVYGALCQIVFKYSLDGLTLRCFDLLSSIGTTGCLALALLNSQGIVATCEGDVPAMLSMALANKVAHTPGFQVNLSQIAVHDYLFAHCTVPLNIVESYSYDTHFESGIGVAIHGEFEPGEATVFKIGADLKRFVAQDVMIRSNQYEDNLCRTQIHVMAPGLAYYVLRNPLGNHHIIVPGHHADDFSNLLK